MVNDNPLRIQDVSYEDLSPMMKQYVDLKKSLGSTLLFYRLGDFYEMFFDDAIYASNALELTLTARDCGNNLRAPMCGVPFHAYSSYASRLIGLGQKVAICEQLEDPATAKGLVKRGLVKVLTPGTITDFIGLDEKKNNYLMSIYCVGSQYGVGVADISTGSFDATQLCFDNNDEHVVNLISKYEPSEIIYNEAFSKTALFSVMGQYFQSSLTLRPEREFTSFSIREKNYVSSVDKEVFSDPELLLCSCGALLAYANETQVDAVSHLNNINVFSIRENMELDYATRTNLEIIETIRSKSKKGSLLWAIDRTRTAMGGRLLRKFVQEPLINKRAINQRLDAVEQAVDKYIARQELIDGLSGLYDIERLSSKISLGSINARELLSLKNSLGKLPYIIESVEPFDRGCFREIKANLDPLTDIYELLDASINEEPPITIKDGDIIKRGVSQECDELYDIATNAKEFIMSIETKERQRTGVSKLKIGYNRVFGYYIEISRSQSFTLPDEYIRKQTLANAERYVTPEIKELEDKILGAQSKRVSLEYQLFTEIREKVFEKIDILFKVSKAIALLDVITSLAELASCENYVRPIVDDSDVIDIVDGRHIVVEKMMSEVSNFVPNSTLLDGKSNRLMVLTGPNMAGKSTYMRQVALIVLLAQIGSFVPAKSAHIGLVDQIFTRIGASDDISTGKSTFMVEMSEVSSILRNATRKSLLLFDEVGRGTSTYDGLSIAWAVIEYIIDPNILFARTIFATHYHELNQLTKLSSGVFNMHVDVKENEDSVVFLHKIVDGGTSDSYGIEVAKLAGLPNDVLRRSRAILKELERIGNFKVTSNIEIKDNEILPSAEAMPGQGSIFNPDNVLYRKEDKIRQVLNDIDITKITPLEAMNLLYGLTDIVKKEKNNEQN